VAPGLQAWLCHTHMHACTHTRACARTHSLTHLLLPTHSLTQTQTRTRTHMGMRCKTQKAEEAVQVSCDPKEILLGPTAAPRFVPREAVEHGLAQGGQLPPTLSFCLKNVAREIAYQPTRARVAHSRGTTKGATVDTLVRSPSKAHRARA